MGDLTNAIFKADLGGNVNTFRQNLQAEYVTMLINIAGIGDKTIAGYDHITRATATANLKNIQKMLAAAPGAGETKVHRDYLNARIQKAFSKS